MATLTRADIAKRSNVNGLVDRIMKKGSFVIGSTDKGDVGQCTGVAKVMYGKTNITYNTSNKKEYDALLSITQMFASTKETAKYEIQLVVNGVKKFVPINSLFKDKDFGGVGAKSSGLGSERQEIGLINLINSSARQGAIYIDSFRGKSENVLEAMKNEGLSKAKQEPYIDIFVKTNKKTYGISCKGESAPSLAGGGLVGLEIVVPDLVKKLYTTIENYLSKELGLANGAIIPANSIPDLAIEIPSKYIRDILVGNDIMGGPIDYMYIGKMDVSGERKQTGELQLNGKFYSIDEYIAKVGGKMFFRIRKRDLPTDNMIEIDYKTKNKSGYPNLWVTPKTTKSHLRIVIVDKAASSYKLLKLV